MSADLKSMVVLRTHFLKEPFVQPLLNEDGVIRCQILDSGGPFVRLKVRVDYGDGKAALGEMLLPHDAVLYMVVDAPEKILGFSSAVPPKT